ncbi:MAG: EpsI family protein [Acidobacteriota bacterium]|nr:EpsI family protein [Acidobacteriota bacterium]
MTRSVWAICLLLAAVLALRVYLDKGTVPAAAPQLSALPSSIGAWHSMGDAELPLEAVSVLKADQLLARNYEVLPGTAVQLFIAYYRTQHAGERMHSPRNCLPGSGWEPVRASLVDADIEGKPVPLNRYDVEKNGQRMVVLYWYQSRNRMIANEYGGRAQLIWDAMHRGARDGALVRVSMKLRPGVDPDDALRAMLQFVHGASPEITRLLVRQ